MFAFFARLLRRQKPASPHGIRRRHRSPGPRAGYAVRIAVYDSPAAPPRVMDITATDCLNLFARLSGETYDLASRKGGRIPYTAIKEIVENLIHARFAEAVVTVMPDGNTIRVSDQGPGVPDRERIFSPGFSTATADMKRYIRGVGSGLPVARESLAHSGGTITVEDNLGRGAVFTLSLSPPPLPVSQAAHEPRVGRQENAPAKENPTPAANKVCSPAELDQVLGNRQKKVLLLLAELPEPAGPSTVARELGVSLTSAHRDLTTLEKHGLVVAAEGGKRRITAAGLEYIGHLFST